MYLAGVGCKYLHDDYKKYPNLFIGYRTRYAMKDQTTWEEANSYIYKPCLISLILSLIVFFGDKFLDLYLSNNFYSIFVLILVFAPLILTEIHLRMFNRFKTK